MTTNFKSGNIIKHKETGAELLLGIMNGDNFELLHLSNEIIVTWAGRYIAKDSVYLEDYELSGDIKTRGYLLTPKLYEEIYGKPKPYVILTLADGSEITSLTSTTESFGMCDTCDYGKVTGDLRFEISGVEHTIEAEEMISESYLMKFVLNNTQNLEKMTKAEFIAALTALADYGQEWGWN